MSGTAQAEHGALEGAMRWVGDLDHPFYNDERQRHIWYESAMIGFQLLVMVQLFVCAIVTIVIGPGSLGYWLIGIGPVFIASVAAGVYASAKGAPYTPGLSDFKRSRGIAGLVLMALYFIGVFRMNGLSFSKVTESPSDMLGFITGLAVVTLIGFLAFQFINRLGGDDGEDDEFD